jgi:hypothetical protein
MLVRILVPHWAGTIGILEDKIDGTNWYNVRVSDDLRLALTPDEFVVSN